MLANYRANVLIAPCFVNGALPQLADGKSTSDATVEHPGISGCFSTVLE